MHDTIIDIAADSVGHWKMGAKSIALGALSKVLLLIAYELFALDALFFICTSEFIRVLRTLVPRPTQYQ